MPSALDTLIPHRAPMQWIDALTDCTDTTACATTCFGASHFAVAQGLVLETALVECAAQTVAAALGQRAKAEIVGSQKSEARGGAGMLAAVSNFQIQARPAAGQPLRVEVRQLKRFGPMLLVSAVVSCDGQLIASGELTLYA